MVATDIEPFATLKDLKLRWPSCPLKDDEYTATLFMDVTDFILAECPDAATAVSAHTLTRITCAVVRRFVELESGDDEGEPSFGFESMQETVGPFSTSFKPISPYGDFSLSPRERKALGVGRQRAHVIDLLPDPDTPRGWPDFYN